MGGHRETTVGPKHFQTMAIPGFAIHQREFRGILSLGKGILLHAKI